MLDTFSNFFFSISQKSRFPSRVFKKQSERTNTHTEKEKQIPPSVLYVRPVYIYIYICTMQQCNTSSSLQKKKNLDISIAVQVHW